MFGNDQLQDRVAQKFQTLVIEMVPVRLVPQARMRKGLSEEKRVPKFVTDSVFERVHGSKII
jgi:hypothetical protein